AATVNINVALAESASSFDQFASQVGNGIAYHWTKVSGPGTVTFSAANAASTNATFDTVGLYVIRVSATDGVNNKTSDATITAKNLANFPHAIATANPTKVRRGTPTNIVLD